MQAGRPTIILDVDGGELGCAEMLQGALLGSQANGSTGLDIVLATSEPQQAGELVAELFGNPQGSGQCRVSVAAARDRLPARIDSPVEAFRAFPGSSIRVAMDCARDTPHSVVISPGSTGLVMTAAMFTLGRVKGIDRVPIGTPMPSRGHELFFVDGGSNVDCKPAHLHQFALLAHLYMQIARGLPRPRVALLSNGSESYKGNALIREAYQLLEQDPDLNFVGYTEGHTMLSGEIDVMVCDGMIGNILLKGAEGIAEFMIESIKQEIKRDPLAALAAKLLMGRAFKRFARRLDYTQFGGAPLLGLKGNVVICHGRSPAVAIKNAITVGARLARSEMVQRVEEFVVARNLARPNGQ